jgi:hypothetical protein
MIRKTSGVLCAVPGAAGVLALTSIFAPCSIETCLDLALWLLITHTTERFGRSEKCESEPSTTAIITPPTAVPTKRLGSFSSSWLCMQFIIIIIIMKLAVLQLLMTVLIAANCRAFQIPSLLPPPLKFFTDSTTTIADKPNANKANNPNP